MNALPEGFDSLDALVTAAIKQAVAKTAKPKKDSGNSTVKAIPSERYSNPANWKAARKIALIHKDSNTLLGAFREMLHLTEPDCRRLVREDSPSLIDAQEFVTGTWGWVEPPRDDSERAPAVVITRLDLEIQLANPAVGGQGQLLVHTQGSGILRIELLHSLTLSDPLGQQFLTLPAGTNLLPVLAYQTKLSIYAQLATSRESA